MSNQEYRVIENIEFYLLVAGALISMVTYTWQFHKMPGVKPQVYIQICKIFWLVAMVLVTSNTELQNKLCWNQVMQIASILSSYFWLVFVMEISRQKEALPIAVKYSVTGIVGCLVLGILSNNWHSLFWQGARLDGQTLTIVLGPGLWAARMISYLFCSLALGFSVRWVLITAGLRRRQAIWCTMAGLVSVIGSILNFIPVVHEFAPIPLCFLTSGFLITWGFYRWHIYNILPLGQEVVVRDMINGLVVVDEYGYIADLNPAAQAILRSVPGKIGSKFDNLAALWPELNEACQGDAIKTVETMRDYPEGRYYYQLNMTPLKIRGQQLGKAIVLKDITEQKEKQAKLLEQQKALSILTERERLGRELHDGRAQVCNFFGLELQAVRSLLCNGQIEKVKKKVDRLIDTVKDLNTDIRESMVGLKETTAAKQDFETKLRDYLAWYEKNRGIATQLIFPIESVHSFFSKIGELQLLRIIQEALTNIRKHAKARRAKVQLEKKDGQLIVMIEDDGCGFDAALISEQENHFGLQIMAERAEEAGGRLEIETKPGMGTKVMVYFCLESVEGELESRENVISR